MKRGFRVTVPWRLNENFSPLDPMKALKQTNSGTPLSSTTLDWGLFTTTSYGTSFQSCCKMWICRLESFYGPCMMVLRPIFFLAFQEILNNLLPEQRIGPGGPTARPAPSSDLQPLLFLSQGTSAVYCLSYRSQWRPAISTVDTEWIRDDSHDTWNFPANQAIAVETRNVLLWSSKWTFLSFSLTYRRPSLGDHASESQGP